MNKILIDKKIISDSDNVRIEGNKITFLSDGDYFIEYVNSGKYKLNFIINNDVNIIECSFNNVLDNNNKYTINDGNLIVRKFYDNKTVNEVIDIDLCHSGSKVNYKFSNICKENENYTINVNHKACSTESYINNKSVALTDSKLNYVINSNVISKAIDSVLDQTTRIVLMGDADTKISPNMYTPLDNVEARHGSVVGTFSDDEVFYLMSKGISYNDTLKLLIKGYLLSNMDIGHDIRKRIIDIISVYWR